MGVYHITYTEGLKEACLYLDGPCNFSCHGCITDWYPGDCHIEELKEIKNKTLKIKEVISYLEQLIFKKIIFLGKEPTQDSDLFILAKVLKERFSTYNILLTNGYEFIEPEIIDEVCVSIKAVSREIFENFTGRNTPERVLENFKRYLEVTRLKVRAESIFIPDYIDKNEIEKIARSIAKLNPSIPYRIDGYIPYDTRLVGKKDSFQRPTEDEMKEVRIVAERYLENVSILYGGIRLRYKVTRVY